MVGFDDYNIFYSQTTDWPDYFQEAFCLSPTLPVLTVSISMSVCSSK